MNSCSPVWQYICSFSKYLMEVFSANLFALLDRYRDTSLIYLLTPNPNTRRYFFVPPKTLLQSYSIGLFLGLLLGFLAFRKKRFLRHNTGLFVVHMLQKVVVYILGIVLEEGNIEWHTSKFQQNMYVLQVRSDAYAILILWQYYCYFW